MRSIGELLVQFEQSSFAKERYQRATALRNQYGAQLQHAENEYLFLGRNGFPYYLHKLDKLCRCRKSPRVGGSLKRSYSTGLARKVISAARQRGLCDLAEAGLGFHDLRGTFAERALTQTIDVCRTRGMDQSRAENVALKHVQRLLGHSSVESTSRYLKFRVERDLLIGANESFGASLLSDTP